MSTQQAVAPASPTTAEPGRRPNRGLLIGAAALAAAGLCTGGWFAFLSPHDSTVTLGADAAQAAPGKAVPLHGRITPMAANRVVEVSTATTKGGPYTAAGTAVTDAAGQYSLTWSPTEAGTVWVRASAVTLGRDQQAQSAPAPVTVRTPASLTLNAGAAAIRTTGNTIVTATLAPAGGAVTFEKSTDGQTWTPLAGATSAKPGVTAAKVAGMPGGLWHIRATAAQTDTATAVTAKEVTVLVEDYKAAGGQYLAIVAGGNKAIDQLNDMIDAGASQAALRVQAEAVSKAISKQAKDFRAYRGWPREVAPIVADLARQDVVEADNFHMRAQSRSVEEWNQIAEQLNAAPDVGGADAARIRDILGLPKRNLHP